MMPYFGFLLVIIHLLLFLWASGGMIELFSTKLPWQPYTNADFPRWLLPIHWGSVLIASAGFLIGYVTQWNKTPLFMLASYTMLFTICVIETIGFMTSPTRHLAMFGELVTYAVILTILFKHKYFVDYFA